MGFREFFAAYARLESAVWRFLLYGEKLEIITEGSTRLVLKTGRGKVTLDGASRTIRRKDSLISGFGEIRRVILRTIAVDETIDMWSVSLEKTDGRIVELGKSPDDVEASIAAAHVAKRIGVVVDAVN